MDEFEDTRPSRRLRVIDLAVVGLGILASLAEVAEDLFDDLQQLTAGHANWLIDRETFHEQAALELEALTREIAE